MRKSILYYECDVRCRGKESLRSLSRLLMSFLSVYFAVCVHCSNVDLHDVINGGRRRRVL